jgi:acetyl esterase/lipase
VLIDQIRLLRDRMVADLGEGDGVKAGEGKVRYFEVPDGCHDYLVLPPHEPERTETLKAIAQWVEA